MTNIYDYSNILYFYLTILNYGIFQTFTHKRMSQVNFLCYFHFMVKDNQFIGIWNIKDSSSKKAVLIEM